jgi:hypothetical protein
MARFHRITTYAIVADSIEAAEEIWGEDGPECADRVSVTDQSELIPGACVIAIVNRGESD